MGEKRLLAVTLTLSLFLGLATLAVAVYLSENPHQGSRGEVYISRYEASLGPDGVLREKYTYVLGERKQMIYRSWDTPLTRGDRPLGSEGYIEVVGVACPPGTVPYVVDYRGELELLLPASPEVRGDVERIIEKYGVRSEAGCYAPQGLGPGAYVAVYTFQLHPPLRCGPDACLLDLSLAAAGRHVYYDEFSVAVSGAQMVYLHPASPGRVEAGHGSWLVEGKGLPSKSVLRILALYPRGTGMPAGSVEEVEDAFALARSMVEDAWYRVSLAKTMLVGAGLAAAAAPLVGVGVYLARGREGKPRYPVPQGVPPDTGEKPWQVNLLYHGQVGSLSTDAVVATILDLADSGVVKLRESSGRVLLSLDEEALKGRKLDGFEAAVVELLRTLGGEEVDLKEVGERVKRDPELKARIKSLALKLMVPGKEAERLAREAVESSRLFFAAPLIASILMAVAAAVLGHQLGLQGIMGGGVIALLLSALTYAPLLAAPVYVYGRWRPGYLEKYLAWRRFLGWLDEMGVGRAGLSRLAGGWYKLLAYAAALGRGEKVARVLEDTGIREAVAAAIAYSYIHTHYHRNRLGGAVPSGGGGGGGGFGGGGAGAR